MAISSSPSVIPLPQNRPVDALLVCEPCGKPTRHQFVRHQRVGEYGAYAQVFACSCCARERRYGLRV